MSVAAASVDNPEVQHRWAIQGNGRKRKRRLNQAERFSHYRYAQWFIGSDGRRKPVEIDLSSSGRSAAREYIANVDRGFFEKDEWEYKIAKAQLTLSPESCDLISSSIMNNSTGTLSVFFLPFDIDYKRSDDRWKKAGSLHWPAIAAFLSEHEPAIFERIAFVVKSTGGRGFGLGIGISPIELDSPSSLKLEELARTLQRRIITILNFYGIGADDGARGLDRWVPNFKDPRRIVDESPFARIWTESRRDPVVLELLRATDNHPALGYQSKKKRATEFLWPYLSVERKLAALYMYMIEEVGLDDSLQATAASLGSQFKLAEKTVRKFLASDLSWISVKHIGGREGYSLTLRPTPALTERAKSLLDGAETETNGSLGRKMRELLIHPSEVQDGDRYEWLGNVLWAIKRKGATESQAISICEAVRMQVPGYARSRALTSNLKASVKTFWRRRLHDEEGNPIIGSLPRLPLPQWLDAVYQPITRVDYTAKIYGNIFNRKGPVGDLLQPPTDPAPQPRPVSNAEEDAGLVMVRSFSNPPMEAPESREPSRIADGSEKDERERGPLTLRELRKEFARRLVLDRSRSLAERAQILELAGKLHAAEDLKALWRETWADEPLGTKHHGGGDQPTDTA